MKQSATFYFGTKLAPYATPTQDGVMSKEDKAKLDNIQENSNNYIHPDSHPATMITEDATHRFITDDERNTWNAKASTEIATISANGLMSAEDKIKLNTVENNANNYIHPQNHPATMITEDATHKFVTDEQIKSWESKPTSALASSEINGLMSKEDKAKLDVIEAKANNYVHPEKHDPSIIIQDETNRFVTDIQIQKWDNKAENKTATTGSNGLMSRVDKQKLDAIKLYKLAENQTVKKEGIITLSFPITTSKFVVLLDTESVTNGQSSPIYKDIGNCTYLLFSIKDIDVSNSALIERSYKFEIISDTQLKYLGGMKVKSEDDSVTTEPLDDGSVFTILGFYII